MCYLVKGISPRLWAGQLDFWSSCNQKCVVSKEKRLCEGDSFFGMKVLFRSKWFKVVTRLDSKESFWTTKVEFSAEACPENKSRRSLKLFSLCLVSL